MPHTEWDRRVAELAIEVSGACARTLAPAQTVLDDQSVAMLAEEIEPDVVPSWPIGTIHRYRVHERRVHRIFGVRWLPLPYRHALLAFGMEDMWEAPRWALEKGLWCSVLDARVDAPVREIMRRFSFVHRIDLHFHPRAA